MKKIIFNDSTEMNVVDVSKVGETLSIVVESEDVNSVVGKFRNNASATSVIRYYVGTDLQRGYAGFTNMQELKFNPDVVTNVDYSETDSTTSTGFKEEKADRCTVIMKKASQEERLAAVEEGQEVQDGAIMDMAAVVSTMAELQEGGTV